MGRRPPTDEYTALPTDTVGRVQETKGSHIFAVAHADGTVVEANLPNRYRSQIWIRRGSFVALRVLPDASLPSIVHILDRSDIKELRKAGKWPDTFITTDAQQQDASEEQDDQSDDSGRESN